MGKNIILCADGTGNRGGYTPDSNVYKIYNAIDIHDTNKPQITFYDNGVGTAKNKYWRALSGAFGFGFKANVCDLYEFLARNYDPSDNVFLFGFSRGAATVRAFSGFVAASGLVDGRKLDQDDLEKRADEVFRAYRAAKKDPSLAKQCREDQSSHGAIPIKFIGMWDTVSALGFPQDWNITGIGMLVLNWLFKALDHLFDFWIFAHRFYNYELTANIQFACQVLAIDDERKSFTPLVWDENRVDERKKDENGQEIGTHIEQVWFAGAHSNVGGGYGRAGLANVSLDWMMTRAHHHGLEFQKEPVDEIRRNANVQGRLVNSRDGFAIYYRYHPREIQKLCWNKKLRRSILRGKVKIHRSVFERMIRKTGNYAPGHLPYEFNVVDNPVSGAMLEATAAPNENTWKTSRSKVNRWVFWRKWLYGIFLEFTLLIVLSAGWFWIYPPLQWGNRASQDTTGWLDWLMGHIADVLNYILPEFFEGLVTVAVIQQPGYFGSAVIFAIFLWRLKRLFRRRNFKACEEARNVVVAALLAPVPKDARDESKSDGGNQ